MKFCSLSVLGEQQQQQWQKTFHKKCIQTASKFIALIPSHYCQLMLMSFPGVELSRTVEYLTLKREY